MATSMATVKIAIAMAISMGMNATVMALAKAMAMDTPQCIHSIANQFYSCSVNDARYSRHMPMQRMSNAPTSRTDPGYSNADSRDCQDAGQVVWSSRVKCPDTVCLDDAARSPRSKCCAEEETFPNANSHAED